MIHRSNATKNTTKRHDQCLERKAIERNEEEGTYSFNNTRGGGLLEGSSQIWRGNRRRSTRNGSKIVEKSLE
jgi:hypothetical protein